MPHPALGGRFVPGMTHPGWQDRDSIMLAELLVGRVQRRLVTIGPAHPGAQIVRDEDPGHPAEELERVHVRVDPTGQLHRRERLHIPVGAVGPNRDEQPRLARLTGQQVSEHHLVPGPVDLQRLARLARNTQHRFVRHRPPAVLLTKERVPIRRLAPAPAALGVLLPHQQQRHIRTSQLPMHPGEVRLAARNRAGRRLAEQPCPDRLGVQALHISEHHALPGRRDERRRDRMTRAPQHLSDPALTHTLPTKLKNALVIDHRRLPSSRARPDGTRR